MGKYKYIHCDVYKRGVSVFIGDCTSLKKWARKFCKEPNEQDMVDFINRSCSDTEYERLDVASRNYTSDSGQCIIHLPKFSFKYDIWEISNLSHELLHATTHILDFVGVEYRYGGSNEPYTYLHEYLLKQALEKKGYTNVK